MFSPPFSGNYGAKFWKKLESPEHRLLSLFASRVALRGGEVY